MGKQTPRAMDGRWILWPSIDIDWMRKKKKSVLLFGPQMDKLLCICNRNSTRAFLLLLFLYLVPRVFAISALCDNSHWMDSRHLEINFYMAADVVDLVVAYSLGPEMCTRTFNSIASLVDVVLSMILMCKNPPATTVFIIIFTIQELFNFPFIRHAIPYACTHRYPSILVSHWTIECCAMLPQNNLIVLLCVTWG